MCQYMIIVLQQKMRVTKNLNLNIATKLRERKCGIQTSYK